MQPSSNDDLISIMEQFLDELEAEAFSKKSGWQLIGASIKMPGRLFGRGTEFFDNAGIISGTSPLCAKFETEEQGNRGETTRAILVAVDSGKLGDIRECTPKSLAVLHPSHRLPAA